jgi:UDP-N-acetylmuramoylalanine--D-glutamate ligase
MADYRRAKLHALEGADEAVISADSPLLFEGKLPKNIFAVCGTHGQAEEVARRLSAEVYYSAEDGYITKNGQRILPTQDLRRREKYNIKNYLTALALTVGFAPEERALEIIRDFGGIPHRGERFDKISGIEFINSSIDTTPERTMSTLREMPEGIIILLGGRDKGLDLSALSALINKRGDRVIAFGEAEDKFAYVFGKRCIKACGGLRCAVAKAAEIARVGDTVLLSPGATSYDEFRSFEIRGNEFKRLVKQTF